MPLNKETKPNLLIRLFYTSPFILLFINSLCHQKKKKTLQNFPSHFKYRFGLISLFNGMSTYVGYLISKSSPEKNSAGTIKSIAGRIKETHISQEYLSKCERKSATNVRTR